MNISDAGAAAAAVVRIVRNVEESNALSKLTILTDLLVEVRNDGDVHSGGASLNPVLAELVAVTSVNGLNGIAEVVQNAGEGLKGPALATLLFPPLAVIFKRTERDEGIVAGATAQDLSARMTDMAVACVSRKLTTETSSFQISSKSCVRSNRFKAYTHTRERKDSGVQHTHGLLGSGIVVVQFSSQ